MQAAYNFTEHIKLQSQKSPYGEPYKKHDPFVFLLLSWAGLYSTYGPRACHDLYNIGGVRGEAKNKTQVCQSPVWEQIPGPCSSHYSHSLQETSEKKDGL